MHRRSFLREQCMHQCIQCIGAYNVTQSSHLATVRLKPALHYLPDQPLGALVAYADQVAQILHWFGTDSCDEQLSSASTCFAKLKLHTYKWILDSSSGVRTSRNAVAHQGWRLLTFILSLVTMILHPWYLHPFIDDLPLTAFHPEESGRAGLNVLCSSASHEQTNARKPDWPYKM